MIYIAGRVQEGKRVGLKEISKATGSPEAFAAKILQQLVKNKLLQSFKGPSGGFELINKQVVTLQDIVVAMDGNKLLQECVLGLATCSGENPCPVHEKFVEIRNQLKDTLLATVITDKNLLLRIKSLKS